MNLDSFESGIDKKILARGYDYYENNCVMSIKETAAGTFEAKVEGTEIYTVEIELDDQGNITDTWCDCPYDLGEYCKHQVAVFLVLRDMKKNISGDTKCIYPTSKYTESTLKSQIPKKSKTTDIKEILSDRTQAELVDFILDIASEYEEIKQRIELYFTTENEQDEILKAISLIRTFIRKNSDRHGFVGYGNTCEAARGAELILEKSRVALNHHKHEHALNLVLCVIHEMLDLLGSADDSDGFIEMTIEESLDFIDEIVDGEELNQLHKESLFNKLLEEASNRRYQGWTDWRLRLLDSCSFLADTPILRNKLENKLAAMISNEKDDSWHANHLAERVNLIIYNLVEKNDGQEKTREFIEQNLQYSSFRKMALDKAMKQKDYDLAIKLAQDGEAQDQNLRGLLHDWKRYRYKAYQLAGKLEEQRELAEYFILDGSMEYYMDLKRTYEAEEWCSVYPRVISMLEQHRKTYNPVYSQILIEEGEKQKLLEYVKASPSSIEHYYKHLVPEFKEDVYGLFLQYINAMAARADKRKDYQGVCAIIRTLKKAGGKEQALAIKQKLYDKYARRPAFRDELTKII